MWLTSVCSSFAIFLALRDTSSYKSSKRPTGRRNIPNRYLCRGFQHLARSHTYNSFFFLWATTILTPSSVPRFPRAFFTWCGCRSFFSNVSVLLSRTLRVQHGYKWLPYIFDSSSAHTFPAKNSWAFIRKVFQNSSDPIWSLYLDHFWVNLG